MLFALSKHEVEYYEEELRKIFVLEDNDYFSDVKEQTHSLIALLLTVLDQFKIMLKKIKEEHCEAELEETLDNFSKTNKLQAKAVFDAIDLDKKDMYIMYVLPDFIQSHFFTALQRLSIEILETCVSSYILNRERVEIEVNKHKNQWVEFCTSWKDIITISMDPLKKLTELKLPEPINFLKKQELEPYPKFLKEMKDFLTKEDLLSMLKRKNLVHAKGTPIYKKNTTSSAVLTCTLMKNGTFSTPLFKGVTKRIPNCTKTDETIFIPQTEQPRAGL